MPYLYLEKELTSSPLTPLTGSLLFQKLSRQKSTQPSVHPCARRTTPPKSDHQIPQIHFAVSILSTSSFIHFLYHIKNIHDLTSTFPSFTMFTTLSFTKECLRPAKFCSIIYPNLPNIYPHITPYTTDILNDSDIILTVTDKNMGCALMSTSLFSSEYKQHFSDLSP